ncbi:uncharacterized protein PSANT_05522 [Moesziomyces antarcticus]|uniref:Uncharacterized protein n=1 Tax=Pseudozyma antarctica TaxID=84753 RepID=A0A5C3FTQ9_PSEA2|nr:uncharacterized protein PSANT_05522 [Moesziomyces antarcticus]
MNEGACSEGPKHSRRTRNDAEDAAAGPAEESDSRLPMSEGGAEVLGKTTSYADTPCVTQLHSGDVHVAKKSRHGHVRLRMSERAYARVQQCGPSTNAGQARQARLESNAKRGSAEEEADETSESE